MTNLFPISNIPRRNTSREVIVVGFAGYGGSCQGIRQALGRDPDHALISEITK